MRKDSLAAREYFPAPDALADRAAYRWMFADELIPVLPLVLAEFYNKMGTLVAPTLLATSESDDVYGYVLPGEFGPDGVGLAATCDDIAIIADDHEIEAFERLLAGKDGVSARNAVLQHLWMDLILMLSHYARRSSSPSIVINRAQRRQRGRRSR